MNFLDVAIGATSLTLDEMIPLVKKEVRYPEYIEWIKDESTEDKTVYLELIISAEHSIFRIGDPDVDIKYETTLLQLYRVQINHIAGNSTIVDGVLRADNIEAATKDGTLKIPKADFGSLSIGGQPIKLT